MLSERFAAFGGGIPTFECSRTSSSSSASKITAIRWRCSDAFARRRRRWWRTLPPACLSAFAWRARSSPPSSCTSCSRACQCRTSAHSPRATTQKSRAPPPSSCTTILHRITSQKRAMAALHVFTLQTLTSPPPPPPLQVRQGGVVLARGKQQLAQHRLQLVAQAR